MKSSFFLFDDNGRYLMRLRHSSDLTYHHLSYCYPNEGLKTHGGPHQLQNYLI